MTLKIYTKTGDDGDTGLFGGGRVPKDHPRVEAYGDVDELNAVIGMARLHTDGESDATLARIQNDLFDLGGDLCVPEAESYKFEPLRIVAAQVERLEAEIDAMNAELEPLNSFVLPGGSAAAAHLHLARTVARRAERLLVALCASEPVNEQALRYLNRLSDHHFVMSRWLNDRGRGDVLWRPGANR